MSEPTPEQIALCRDQPEHAATVLCALDVELTRLRAERSEAQGYWEEIDRENDRLRAERDRLREAAAKAYPIIQREKALADGSYGSNYSKPRSEAVNTAYTALRAVLGRES